MKTPFLFAAILIFCTSLFGQEGNDSTYLQEQDTLTAQDDGDTVEEAEPDYSVIYNATADSIPVEKRSFDDRKLRGLQSDPDLDYKQAPTVAESLWDRFLMWIGQILETLFKGAVNTDWGRLIVYAIGLALLVALIMMVLKVNAFKVLYSGAGSTRQYNVLDENIHEMDFENLLREAVEQQDYRRGIRLLFLYALKLLADRHLIQFASGKTNHDYASELQKQELRPGFNELSFYFEYAWYGNFGINQETFARAQNIFSEWKNKLHG